MAHIGQELALGHVGGLGFLGLALQRLQEPPLFGDVVEHQHHARQLSGRIEDRGRAVFDGHFAAVFGNQGGVVGQGDGLLLAEHLGHHVDGGLPRLFVDRAEDAGDGPSHGLVRRPAGQVGGDRVQERDAAADIGGQHRVADAIQRDAEPFAVPVYFRFRPRMRCAAAGR